MFLKSLTTSQLWARDMEQIKQCAKCTETDRSKFGKNQAEKDGLSVYCHSCAHQIQTDWRSANPEKVRASRRRANFKVHYEMTPEQVEALRVEQHNRCAVCAEPFEGYGKGAMKIAVDHDHLTRVVRGLIHQKCNFMIGQANDDPLILEAAARYLRERSSNQASAVGA